MTKRNLWILTGLLILISATVSGFILLIPSAEDILVSTIETVENLTTVHAVLEVDANTVEKSGTATIEVWGKHSDNGLGAFRLEVLETSEDKALGAVVVSDGQTVWAYAPAEGKAFSGTVEEAKALMAEKYAQGDLPSHDDPDHDLAEHPENAQETVQKLLEYATADRLANEDISGKNTYLLKLEPIAEKMPEKYAGVGGFVQLWIDQARSVPLAATYTGGILGEIKATVLALELDPDIDEALFTYEFPSGVEVLGFSDLKPQSLTLEEAVETAAFKILTPTSVPDGAVLVDLLAVGETIVQRYTLPAGGSFTIIQSVDSKELKPSAEAQTVSVRQVEGKQFTAEESTKVLLTWIEDGVTITIAGDISSEDALMTAESLR